MKIYYKCFIRAILAGMVIAIGGITFLTFDNKYLGSLFFTAGLFLVLTRGYDLYTGKIGNLIVEKPSYIISLLIIWVGNFVGSVIMAGIVYATKITDNVNEKLQTIVQNKLTSPLISSFFLAVLCGFIIFFAVENFKENKHEFGKYTGLVLLIPIFVYCGFEHCVADMFYIIYAKEITLQSIGFILVVTLGNSVGSIFCKLMEKQFK